VKHGKIDPTSTQTDHVLDTLSTGSDGPLWAYADYALPGVQRLAELAQPDVIKIDPGEPGSVETTWVDNAIPAITLEIGPAKNWNQTLIGRAESFVYRLLDDLQMDTTKPFNQTAPVTVDLSQTYKATNVSPVTGRVLTVRVDAAVEQGAGVVDVVYNATSSE